jgi:L-asparaginase II
MPCRCATSLAQWRNLRHPRSSVAAEAMIGHPWLGSGRCDTRAMAAGGSRFGVKMGAEGVHVGIIPNLDRPEALAWELL